MQHKWGRVWASLFGRGSCTQSRYPPLHSPPTITQVLSWLRSWLPQDSCSSLLQLHYIMKCASTNFPSRNGNLASWNWEVINKEIGHWSLQLPSSSTSNQCTFILGNETKHKGATKGDGEVAVCDRYGNEDLGGNEQSGDEELRGDERSGDEELKEGKNGYGRSHLWWQSSNMSGNGVASMATCRGGR